MTGIAVHLDKTEINSVNTFWAYTFYPSKQYSLQKLTFVIFCVGDKPVLAGKISSITCYPNDNGRPHLVKFSELKDDPAISDIYVGTARDEILLLKTETGSRNVPTPSFNGSRSKPKKPSPPNSNAHVSNEDSNPFLD